MTSMALSVEIFVSPEEYHADFPIATPGGVQRLQERDGSALAVRRGTKFSRRGDAKIRAASWRRESPAAALARLKETGVVDNEVLPLWDLAEDLSICAGDLRKQVVVNDGEPDGLFCHWDDATGMQIWRLLTAIKAAGEAVEEVAYRFSRALEDADQPSGDVSEQTI